MYKVKYKNKVMLLLSCVKLWKTLTNLCSWGIKSKAPTKPYIAIDIPRMRQTALNKGY